MEEKKPIKLEEKHWIIIAAACFVLVLTLVLCLAFCGKGNENGNSGEGSESGESESLDPGGTYDEEGNFTGAEGTVDPNWDVNN